MAAFDGRVEGLTTGGQPTAGRECEQMRVSRRACPYSGCTHEITQLAARERLKQHLNARTRGHNWLIHTRTLVFHDKEGVCVWGGGGGEELFRTKLAPNS